MDDRNVLSSNSSNFAWTWLPVVGEGGGGEVLRSALLEEPFTMIRE